MTTPDPTPVRTAPRHPLACAVCAAALREGAVAVTGLRPGLRHAIEAAGDAPSGARICSACLEAQRLALTRRELEEERGELTAIEEAVARKAALHETMARNLDDEFAQTATRGQKVADMVARIGGSWAFVLSFFGLLVFWMASNTWLLMSSAFDPYPYILLNLVLSSVAAMQAPIIMMSQNRTAQRDRSQADHTFQINLKAELEIAGLHDKIDHLLHARWEHLITIQTEQLDLMETILADRVAAARAT